MNKEYCEKCGCNIFHIESQALNGGYTAERICASCGDRVEIIDTYNDSS